MVNIMHARHLTELRKAVANHQYDQTEKGVYFPKQQIEIAGFFTVDVNGENPEICYNAVADVGMDHILDVVLRYQTVGTWYISMFTAPAQTPDNTWTMTTFVDTGVEFTAYSGNRPSYVADAASGQSIVNAGTPASFTIDGVADPYNLNGAGILNGAVKGTKVAPLIAAAKFNAQRTVAEFDVVNIQYTVSLV